MDSGRRLPDRCPRLKMFRSQELCRTDPRSGQEAFFKKEFQVPRLPQDEAAPLSDDAGTVEEVLKEEGPLTQDEILDFSGLEASRLSVLLLQLELARSIKRTADGKYVILKSLTPKRIGPIL